MPDNPVGSGSGVAVSIPITGTCHLSVTGVRVSTEYWLTALVKPGQENILAR